MTNEQLALIIEMQATNLQRLIDDANDEIARAFDVPATEERVHSPSNGFCFVSNCKDDTHYFTRITPATLMQLTPLRDAVAAMLSQVEALRAK